VSNGNDVVTETVAGPNGAVQGVGRPSSPRPLPPLAVSALMVTKADLIAALRIYLPTISDLEAIDGDRFLLSVSGTVAEQGGHA
jgi:hypothetical protein